MRSRRMISGSSHLISTPETTWLKGIILPATGLHICRLLISSTLLRSARGGRAMIGSSLASCGNTPAAVPPGCRKNPTTRPLEAASQRLGNVGASETVAPGLDFEHLWPKHHFRLMPVCTYSQRLAVFIKYPLSLAR